MQRSQRESLLEQFRAMSEEQITERLNSFGATHGNDYLEARYLADRVLSERAVSRAERDNAKNDVANRKNYRLLILSIIIAGLSLLVALPSAIRELKTLLHSPEDTHSAP